MTGKPRPKSLTSAELAEEWRCSVGSINRAIRSGELRAALIAGRWLISEEDADEYRRKNTSRGPSISAALRARNLRQRTRGLT